MSAQLFEDVSEALRDAGRHELVQELRGYQLTKASVPSVDVLKTGEVAALLGVSSTNTVKNWLHAGVFPGAYKTRGGHWRFPRAQVEAVRARMERLEHRNRLRDLAPPDLEDDGPEPPLL